MVKHLIKKHHFVFPFTIFKTNWLIVFLKDLTRKYGGNNQTKVINHSRPLPYWMPVSPSPSLHQHKVAGTPTTTTDGWTPPNPAAAQTTLSPASYSQPVANSFRQAWERGCIQAGSAPRAARSGRTNRGSGQETGPLPRGLRPLANPLSS